jgi:hypothetical protein
MSFGACSASQGSKVNVSGNHLGCTGDGCNVALSPLHLTNNGGFFFEKNNMTGSAPQIQFSDVNATDTCKVIVDKNNMTCTGGPCNNAFFWFSALVAISGSAELSVSDNNCGGLDSSIKPLLILLSSVITPCVRCTVHFCVNVLFGSLLETTDSLMKAISSGNGNLVNQIVACLGESFSSAASPVVDGSGVSMAMLAGTFAFMIASTLVSLF